MIPATMHDSDLLNIPNSSAELGQLTAKAIYGVRPAPLNLGAGLRDDAQAKSCNVRAHV